MASPHSDSYDSHTRKRVGKACDRCRLKKSKCDGSNPCSRCKVDNAICVFGERKKSHDKVYPKGYVEMLEQQQSQLVAGIREMYRRLQNGDDWPGAPLQDYEGYPLTHDILERLDVLHMTGENPIKSEGFEDDFNRLQERLLEGGAGYVHHHHRAGSVSSDSEPGLSHADSPRDTPTSRSLSSFSESLNRKKRDSPDPQRRPQSNRIAVPNKRRHFAPPEIHHTDADSLQLWQEPWVMQSPEVDNLDASLFSASSASPYDATLSGLYNPLLVNPLTQPALNTMAPASMGGWADPDPEFASFMRSGYHGTLA